MSAAPRRRLLQKPLRRRTGLSSNGPRGRGFRRRVRPPSTSLGLGGSATVESTTFARALANIKTLRAGSKNQASSTSRILSPSFSSPGPPSSEILVWTSSCLPIVFALRYASYFTLMTYLIVPRTSSRRVWPADYLVPGPKPPQLHPLAQRAAGLVVIRQARRKAVGNRHRHRRQLHLSPAWLYPAALGVYCNRFVSFPLAHPVLLPSLVRYLVSCIPR